QAADPQQGQPFTAPKHAPPTSQTRLNAKYTFDTFVIGSSNRFAHAAAVAAEYSADSFDFASLEWAQILTDRAWALSTWELAEALSGRSETFVYEFADRGAPHILPFPPGFPAGAYHSAELLYQFDLGEPADLGEAQRKLARTMNSYWANFARTGDPNGEGLPEWAPFASGDPHVQQLAPERIERTDFAADHRLEFWREL
ncbi:carboxylesterase family protein, partial [Klebsiella pneumoniae]|nr:carboxylesterase family protein [Klebsiella pneumoniae]